MKVEKLDIERMGGRRFSSEASSFCEFRPDNIAKARPSVICYKLKRAELKGVWGWIKKKNLPPFPTVQFLPPASWSLSITSELNPAPLFDDIPCQLPSTHPNSCTWTNG
jgi:hypothetical protein